MTWHDKQWATVAAQASLDSHIGIHLAHGGAAPPDEARAQAIAETAAWLLLLTSYGPDEPRTHVQRIDVVWDGHK